MGLQALLRPRRLVILVVALLVSLWFLLGLAQNAVVDATTGAIIQEAAPRLQSAWDKALAKADKLRSKRPANVETARGLVKLQSGSDHPIYQLIENGKKHWDSLISRQSKTLGEAVAAYRERYDMQPPAGFDAWFNYCQTNNVKIIDDFDSLHSDILPYHAISPTAFRARQRKFTEKIGHSYNMTITPTAIVADGDRADAVRPGWMMDLIRGFQAHLPADFLLEVFASDHDMGQVILGRDQYDRLMEAISLGEYVNEEELKRFEDPNRTEVAGWLSACRPEDPGITEDWRNLTRTGKSLIHDHGPLMDFCQTPTLKSLQGVLSLDYRHRSPSELRPMLVLSKMPNDSEFRVTALDAFRNYTAADYESQFAKWQDKTDPRIFWRGLGTGGFNLQIDWRLSQRMRLHLMLNGKKTEAGQAEFREREVEVMRETIGGSWEVETRRLAEVAKAYTDVSLVGKPHQCENEKLCDIIAEEIDFGPRVQPEETVKYKYVVDCDGNGWSSRFHRLLSSGSVVYKMTNTPEWNQEWLVPWYHYIPVQPDYSDLFDIQSFFAGPLDESGVIDSGRGHDDLARAIGEAGQSFTKEHWRWQDMQAYMFRLLLEIRRLAADDRELASYQD